jgi:hypothetical protein
MVVINKKHKDSVEEKEAKKQEEAAFTMGIQDEYQAKGFELVQWTQDHKGVVTICIVALLALGGGFSAYSYYKQRANEEASAAYFEALKSSEEDLDDEGEAKPKDLDKTKLALQNVIQQHKNSDVAILANLQAGFLALTKNEPKEALEFYQVAFSKISSKDNLYPLALMGLSKALDKNNKPTEALEHFEKIIAGDKSFPGRDVALWEAVRLTKENNKEKAKKYLNLLLEDYPSSSYEQKAKNLQATL